MMIFDKKEYRKRREAGLRGQGDEPVTRKPFLGSITPSKKLVSKKAILKNTKRARKAALHGI